MRFRMVLGGIAAVFGVALLLSTPATYDNPGRFVGIIAVLGGLYFLVAGAVSWAQAKDAETPKAPPSHTK